MARFRRALCLLALLALLFTLYRLRAALPADRQALIEEKYGGWSGVLRTWCFEGWPPGAGSAAPWLRRCVTAFERAHPGVYIQVDSVDAATLSGWMDGGMAPDLLLFPPGLLATPEELSPLKADIVPRDGLARLGDWNGVCYALPVAMGIYARVATDDDAQGFLVPADEPYRLWSAARAALDDAKSSDPGAMPTPAAPDLDLGLPASSAAGQSAWRRFANGEAGALLASQREVVCLSVLQEQGKGPEWHVDGVSPFTDQLLFAAVPRGSAADRHALALAFAAGLLADECQGELHRAGLFPVTDAPGSYGPSDPLGQMEVLLRGQAPVAPRAFGLAWREETARLSDGNRDSFINSLRRALAG